ncbi:MAG: hypothetical protein EON54_26780 [Alcaligenaceae bacterium]|nr:MAG: hypothetical protein EON54_26780 [Alcaligenaceae bacterium]
MEYIKNGRKELLSQAGVTEKETEGRLFVSQLGRPLDDRGYGEIFSDAFSSIGAPKGSGAHAIRRYRTQLEVIREITRRRAAGLPIIREEVCRVVMDLLGHTSEEAGRSYDRVSERLRFEAEESGIAQRLEKAELERDSLRAVLAHLRNKLPRELLKDLPPSLAKLTDIKLGRPASSLSAMPERA